MYSLKIGEVVLSYQIFFQNGSISIRGAASSEELQPKPFQLQLEPCQTSPMSTIYDRQQMIQTDNKLLPLLLFI